MPQSAAMPTPQDLAPTADEGIMSALYRQAIGPVRTEYYLRHFLRFEALGKTQPSWNSAAAGCTLAWLLMRRLWRPAGLYAAILLALGLSWWWGLHGRIPLMLEAVLLWLAGLLLCLLPGYLGNALYYRSVRNQTLHALRQARNLAQAQHLLARRSVSQDRLLCTIIVQGLVAISLAWFALSNRLPPVAASPRPSAADLALEKLARLPAIPPAPTAVAPTVSGSALLPGRYYLNTGRYLEASEAQQIAQRLEQAQLPVLRQRLNSNQGEFIRLRVGPYDSQAQAEAAQAILQGLQLQASWFQYQP